MVPKFVGVRSSKAAGSCGAPTAFIESCEIRCSEAATLFAAVSSHTVVQRWPRGGHRRLGRTSFVVGMSEEIGQRHRSMEWFR
mmetsp:Transcript_12315/g.31151  ORF Transcript_12315/g.31151 Transcript_12315/m.31151 type:complete len:83 (-) Transcript_12315:28-276(-)